MDTNEHAGVSLTTAGTYEAGLSSGSPARQPRTLANTNPESVTQPHRDGLSSPATHPHLWTVHTPLPDGPLDLVGDLHGEIGAVRALLARLGYSERGDHAEGRTLVFLGDLIDRGPDSPGVVRMVADMVDRGRAVCVMGNHDLNAAAGLLKADNTWLLDHGPVHPTETKVASHREREEIFAFLKSLPLAMSREDLRVVHACWDESAMAQLQHESDVAKALSGHRDRVKAKYAGHADNVDVTLALQNENPVKLITSGPEARAHQPFFAGGEWRHEARHPWWDTYSNGPMVVFGHYWRVPIPSLQKDDGLLSAYPLHSTLGAGRAICIDYSVGGRASERREGRTSNFLGRLAALRWPERELVFDDGERRAMIDPDTPQSTGGTR